jgi:hypothetical protein
MAQEVSWLVVDSGWRVVGPDGSDLAQVEEVVGDSGKDIFNGLAVRGGTFSHNRYVPAELVTRIEDGAVYVDAASLDELEEYPEPPQSERFRAD